MTEVIGVDRVKKAIDEAVRKKHLAIMLYLDRNIVLATPKDTGRAQGNWIASISNPSKTVKKIARKQNNTPIISRIKPYSKSYLSNNLPYIKRLNNGWSSQNNMINWVGFIAKEAAKNAR
jgi:hypothetical protein